METMPLRAILRKLLWMRVVVCTRRIQAMLRTKQGRQRALIAVAAIVILTVCALSVGQLPDPDDHIQVHHAAHLHAGISHAPDGDHRPSHKPAPIVHKPRALDPAADLPAGAVDVGAAVPDESASSPPAPPAPAAPAAPGASADAGLDHDSAEYAAELRRRAAELNQEIARFKEHENKASKAQRLRLTAEQLDSELKALKQVRQAAFQSLAQPSVALSRPPQPSTAPPLLLSACAGRVPAGAPERLLAQGERNSEARDGAHWGGRGGGRRGGRGRQRSAAAGCLRQRPRQPRGLEEHDVHRCRHGEPAALAPLRAARAAAAASGDDDEAKAAEPSAGEGS